MGDASFSTLFNFLWVLFWMVVIRRCKQHKNARK